VPKSRSDVLAQGARSITLRNETNFACRLESEGLPGSILRIAQFREKTLVHSTFSTANARDAWLDKCGRRRYNGWLRRIIETGDFKFRDWWITRGGKSLPRSDNLRRQVVRRIHASRTFRSRQPKDHQLDSHLLPRFTPTNIYKPIQYSASCIVETASQAAEHRGFRNCQVTAMSYFRHKL
jgi:hypothetical protein